MPSRSLWLFSAFMAACSSVEVPPEAKPKGPPVAPSRTGLCQVALACESSIVDEPKSACTLTINEVDGTVAYQGAAGVELRGRSSLSFPKAQYAVELRSHSELLVTTGANWKYLDDGSDPGTAWRQVTFDDANWKSGWPTFGFGEPYLVTEVDSATTVWFRTELQPSDLPSTRAVTLGLHRNDGAAVWLNGVEILRDNLPIDADFDTWALAPTTWDEEIAWITADVDPGLLLAGTNVLAVEVHQAQASPGDMRFTAWLEAAGDEAPTDLFDMGKEEDWILNGQYADRVLWRNHLAFDLFQDLGSEDRYATQMTYCELTLNGAYEGLYTLGEKIEQDDDRVDIGEGGFVVKLSESEGYRASAVSYGQWEVVSPALSPAVEALADATLAPWEAAILSDHPEDLFLYLDLDSAVDWVLVQELLKNHDAYYLSVHLYRDTTGKMYFSPWDFDLSMGYPYVDCGAEGWVSRRYHDAEGVGYDVAFIQAMAAVPSFHDALVARWQALRAGPWAESEILGRIAAYDSELAPAIEANNERWPIEDIALSFGGVDNWLCPVSSYDEEHQRTVDFLTARLAWMDENIEAF